MNKPMKILVVEDDDIVRTLLERVLTRNGYTVVAVEDGTRGEEMAVSDNFDCIILDLGLPDKNGLEVCKFIRDHNVDTPLLILSAYNTVNFKVNGLDFGADDYLTKPFENEELLARIEAITRRYKSGKGNEVIELGDFTMDFIKREFMVNGRNVFLTNSEFDLMAYFLKNPNRIIDSKELAENVWEIKFDTKTNYINVYMSYLRKKIKEISPKNYLQTVRKKGFILNV
jgi:DNA-binding response OmpR family regulator